LPPDSSGERKEDGTMELRCPDFAEGEEIPDRYTAFGDNLSPPLVWDGAPGRTRSFALVVEDPDGHKTDFCHWVLFNVPCGKTGIAAGVRPARLLGEGEQQGLNDYGEIGYGGPKPPEGTHRYVFRLFALGQTLKVDGDLDREDLLTAIRDHVLEEATLLGTCSAR
jgi:Raf kinase inhibitor-like YbhB/YbcL family protein